MRRYLSALAVALVALSGAARAWSVQQSTLAVVIGYDLDSTSFVYPVALGPTAVPSTLIRPQAVEGWYETPASIPSGATVDRRIKTADYDPTVVSCVSSSSALEPLSTGDMVNTQDVFNRPVYASVFSITSAETMELDRSVDLTQDGCARYRYRKLDAGSDIYDGWFSIAGYTYTTIQVDMSQYVGTGGVDIVIECAAAHALDFSEVLASSNIAAAASVAVAIPEPWDICRVGMKLGTSDDDSTPATDNEKISVFAIRRN